MKKNEKNDEVEIDLLKLASAVWKNKWACVFAFLAGAVIAASVSIFLITPKYRAEFQAYVYNYQDTSSISSITSSDYSASSYLATTYASIIVNRTVMEAALAETSLDYTFEDVESAVSTSVVDDTQIITVYVTMADPQEAYELASALETVCLEMMPEIVEGSSIQIISSTQLPTTKYSPSNTKNTIIGALAGLIIALIVIIIRALVDNTVKDEDGLEAAFGIHIIGSIPNFDESAKGGSYYYSYRGRQSPAADRNTKPAAETAAVRAEASDVPKKTASQGQHKSGERRSRSFSNDDL